jgi:phosphopantothenoylcysteine decarboxylase/phosphopantothenate--cysteine ligase
MEKKCVIVGVTGGIAAYKACTLVSHLKKAGHEVHVLMSVNAMKFVSPLTFQALSGHQVITDTFMLDDEEEVHHIALARKADVFVVAPASADFIAKAANGLADDMLTTTFLAAYCPKLVVPAMNTHMLENPATQANIARLKSYGIRIMESSSGYLACGDVGRGRMPEPDAIIDAMGPLLCSDHFLKGKKIVVSAGPTCEDIDPVRYITNHSSGKMGYALARAARDMGADVVLVSGRTALDQPYGIRMRKIVSAADMADAVLQESTDADAVIMAAAVADYTPLVTADEKIKKSEGDLSIGLKRTQDILLELGRRKKDGQVLIGFAMETEHLLENAAKKLAEKNADYIVANSIADPGAGFGVDTNKITILSEEGQKAYDLMSKDEAARTILKACLGGKRDAVSH